jgi:hypothetical protein
MNEAESTLLESDKSCHEPLYTGMEEPGICSFSDNEIDNQAKSVLCYLEVREVLY